MKKWLFVGTVLLLFKAGLAQTIRGKVIDKDVLDGIPGATVLMHNDTVVAYQTITDSAGLFTIALKIPCSVVEIRSLGYETRQLPVDYFRSDTLALVPLSGKEMDEVVVVGEKNRVEIRSDRKIIHLGTDIQQSGANILEAFDQIASIQTDLSEGTIALRGTDNVQVLIDGKPSPLNVMEALAQIPASNVDRVEIVTSPSAKFRSDGVSGVINIILKSKRNRDYALTANAAVGTKRYQGGFDANRRLKQLNFRLGGFYARRNMNSEQTLHRIYQNDERESIYTMHNYAGYLTKVYGGVDWYGPRNSELSLTLRYTDDWHRFENPSNYYDRTTKPDLVYLRKSKHEHYTTDVNWNYLQRFNKEKQLLEVDFNVTQNKNNFPLTDIENDLTLFFESLNNQNTLTQFSADYVHPVSKKITLETGLFHAARLLTSKLQHIPVDSAEWLQHFAYDENTFAAYGIVKRVYNQLELMAGLRFEYFVSHAKFNSGSSSTQKFPVLFPSVHVKYNFSDRKSITWSYGKRITRPNFRHINPYQIGNPYFNLVGNPNLTPEISHNTEATYLYVHEKGNFSGTFFYRYTKNTILYTAHVNAENKEILGFQNQGEKHQTGIELSALYRLFNFWSAVITYNYNWGNIRGVENITWKNTYNSALQLRQNMTIGKKIAMDVSYNLWPRRQNIFNYIDLRYRFDCGVRVKLYQNKLILNCRVIDVFDKNLMLRTTQFNGLTQDETWRFQSQTRSFMLTATINLAETNQKKTQRIKRDYSHGGATD